MRAFIVDDERLAREELRELLRSHPEIDIVGEAANAPEALSMIRKFRPELLFLDIRLPEQDGFQLLEALGPPLPRVIFVSAYDHFALRAFQVNALDYLVKPVEPDRLAGSLQRLPRSEEPVTHVREGEPRSSRDLSPGSRVFLRDGDRCWFIAIKDLTLLEAEGNATRVYFGKEKPLLSLSLATLEPRLPAEMFLRANRSQIVNLSSIETVEPWFSRTLRLKLQGGITVELSRRQAQWFRTHQGL